MISKKYPIVDSSLFIEYFLEGNGLIKVFPYMQLGGYFNLMILAETSNFVQHRTSSVRLMKMLDEIFDETAIFYLLLSDEHILGNAHKIMSKYSNNNFSLTDCYTLAQAEYYGLRVVTHDARMASYKNVEVVVVPR